MIAPRRCTPSWTEALKPAIVCIHAKTWFVAPMLARRFPGRTTRFVEVVPFQWTVFRLAGYMSIRAASRSAS